MRQPLLIAIGFIIAAIGVYSGSYVMHLSITLWKLTWFYDINMIFAFFYIIGMIFLGIYVIMEYWDD